MDLDNEIKGAKKAVKTLKRAVCIIESNLKSKDLETRINAVVLAAKIIVSFENSITHHDKILNKNFNIKK